jgi:agmatine deiminase
MTISLNAEWSKQSAVMLVWPHHDSDWRDNLGNAEGVYRDLVARIAQYETVLLLYRNDEHFRRINTILRGANVDSSRIRWQAVVTNDTWARDFGPITVSDSGRPVLLDFTFNGWGGKYAAGEDNRATVRLHANGCFGTTPIRKIDFVLEGGSIDSDGQGSLLTTRQCLLTPTRNPDFTEQDIEALFKAYLGVDRVLWLDHGELRGDDTDSHIDMLARFCSPGIIAYSSCDDPEDEHYTPLQAMQAELQQLRQRNGARYQLIALPIPAAKYAGDGRRLPASYANFLIINGAVLLPVYDDPADAIAITRLQECFPDREVIAINCLPLIRQSGSLHCVTMQLPEGVIKP